MNKGQFILQVNEMWKEKKKDETFTYFIFNGKERMKPEDVWQSRELEHLKNK